MAHNVVSVDREQLMLMPPSVSDWLPEDHFAWFVLDVVDELDLSAFMAVHRSDGRGGAAYHPAMMVALLVYAYSAGERSSRQIERRCVEDVAFGVIAANQSPDHATIARFRAAHAGAISGLFGQVLALCVRAEVLRPGLLAVDGTKLNANASRDANRTAEQLAAEILAEAAATDAAEDAAASTDDGRTAGESPGLQGRGPERRARLKHLLARQLPVHGGRDRAPANTISFLLCGVWRDLRPWPSGASEDRSDVPSLVRQSRGRRPWGQRPAEGDPSGHGATPIRVLLQDRPVVILVEVESEHVAGARSTSSEGGQVMWTPTASR